jgi:two-component system sensor histidine kinase KdpD
MKERRETAILQLQVLQRPRHIKWMFLQLRRSRWLARLPKGIGAMSVVLLTTVLFETIIHVNASTAGFVYLIEVFLAAAYVGFYESIAVAVSAAFCFNYFFLPPIRKWEIRDPHNWVALIAFLAGSLIAGRLSSNARHRAEEAKNKQLEMERLYELSRAIMAMNPNQSMPAVIADKVLSLYPVRGVAIFDLTRHTVHAVGEWGIPNLELRLKIAAREGIADYDPESETLIQPIHLGHKCLGSIALKGSTQRNAALHALLNLIAMAMENALSHEMASGAEAVRQSEGFKSTLLDALAHEFKTPLTSIKGATTALLSGSKLNERQREDLLTVMDQEADRLNGLVTEAIQLARIEAGHLELNLHPHTIAELVGGALDQLSLGRDGRAIELAIDENIPFVQMDLTLMQVALRQLLDNAVKYSAPSSPIAIRAAMVEGAVEIQVRNWGVPLSEEELARVFEKFYRGWSMRQPVLGTGMGLAIAREILLAHGGDIRAESSSERGTLFILRFPAGSERQQV